MTKSPMIEKLLAAARSLVDAENMNNAARVMPQETRERYDQHQAAAADALVATARELAGGTEPVPMFLTCPGCGMRHIDTGRFATHPHHTHSCQGCGLTWRPAIGPTVGVAFLPGFKDPTPTGERRERLAITKVVIDATALVHTLGLHRVVHDLKEDEALCTLCRGLGLVKCESRFGLGDNPSRVAYDDPDPLRNQWVMHCPECYMGVAKICSHCHKPMSRGSTRCGCEGWQKAGLLEQVRKEEARRARCERVPLAEYEGDFVYSADRSRFVGVDEIGDHLVDYPDDVLFACLPEEPITTPDVDQVIETLETCAYENANPEDGDSVLDFKTGHREALEAALKAWSEAYVVPRMMHYPDMKTIVVCPPPEEPWEPAPPPPTVGDEPT